MRNRCNMKWNGIREMIERERPNINCFYERKTENCMVSFLPWTFFHIDKIQSRMKQLNERTENSEAMALSGENSVIRDQRSKSILFTMMMQSVL